MTLSWSENTAFSNAVQHLRIMKIFLLGLSGLWYPRPWCLLPWSATHPYVRCQCPLLAWQASNLSDTSDFGLRSIMSLWQRFICKSYRKLNCLDIRSAYFILYELDNNWSNICCIDFTSDPELDATLVLVVSSGRAKHGDSNSSNVKPAAQSAQSAAQTRGNEQSNAAN